MPAPTAASPPRAPTVAATAARPRAGGATPPPPAAPVAAADGLLDLVRALGRCEDFDAAAATACVQVATTLGAARAVLGWRTRGRAPCRPVALSGAGRPDFAPDAAARLAAAMDEAIDQARLLACPAEPGQRAVLRAHEVLRRAGDSRAVLTVPLARGGVGLGALLVEFAEPPPPQASRRLLAAASLVAPWLALLDRQRPGMLRRAAAFAGLVAPGTGTGRRAAASRGARIVAAAAVVALLAAATVPVEVSVSAPARIEGEVQRTVAAPIRGYLKAVHARPGDAVRAGDLLAELGDRDLELDRTRLRSELAQHEGAAAAAMARGERAAMAVAQSKVEETRSRLGLVEHQLEQIRLRAPIDGVLIQGDLWQQLGAPVDRGQSLFVVAPVHRHRVVVELDERDLRRVYAGQPGRLALSALPWDALPVSIERIAPAAASLDGRNVFELEARLTEPDGGLRPGLRGVAHLQAGRAPPLREWGRRVAEAAARVAWRWLP